MELTGIIIDLAALIFVVLSIVFGVRRGAFKMLMSLVCVVTALLLSYAFSPTLSAKLYNGFFREKTADAITDTVASLCESGTDNEDNALYDVSLLKDDGQFISILEKFGADTDKVFGLIDEITETGRGAVVKISYSLSSGVAEKISDVTAFSLIFVVSVIILRIITAVVGIVFRLPILKTLNKSVGGVLGGAAALFFVAVCAVLLNCFSDTLSGMAGWSQTLSEKSVVMNLASRINFLP